MKAKAKRWWVYVYLETGTRLFPSRSFGPFRSLSEARILAESIGTKGFWEEHFTEFIPPGKVDGVSIRNEAPPSEKRNSW